MSLGPGTEDRCRAAVKFVQLNTETSSDTIKTLFSLFSFVSTWIQKAEVSDDDEEGKSLITHGVTSAKEEKENETFFRKVNWAYSWSLDSASL